MAAADVVDEGVPGSNYSRAASCLSPHIAGTLAPNRGIMTFLSFAALATTLFAADTSIPPADGITASVEVHSGGPPMTGGWTLSPADVMPDDMALPAWVETPEVVSLADPAKPSPALPPTVASRPSFSKP